MPLNIKNQIKYFYPIKLKKNFYFLINLFMLNYNNINLQIPKEINIFTIQNEPIKIKEKRKEIIRKLKKQPKK